MLKKRLDIALVEMGLSKSRSQAQQLIKDGFVFYRGEKVTKTSLNVDLEELEVKKSFQYVGRGSQKLIGALEYFKVNPTDFICADVGASTGGFTEVLLENGAKKVYAIDVGHDQLDNKLVMDERVVNLEGINIRYGVDLEEKVDLVVADLSYISLTLVLNPMFSLLKENGQAIILVKPQFEVGREKIGKNGIVKVSDDRLASLKKIFHFCTDNKLMIKGMVKSSITGKTGNVEYLFYFDQSLPNHLVRESDLELL